MGPASEETTAMEALPPRSGHRGGPARALARIPDALLAARDRALRTGARLDRSAAALPRRRVAAYGVYGERGAAAIAAAATELRRSQHAVEITLGALGAAEPALAAETALTEMEGGKLANLNRLLAERPPAGADWVLLLDDDAGLPAGFLERMLALAESFRLDLAQPALTRTSHTAWPLTRRRPCLARRTGFVEMGPVLLVRGALLPDLIPFPEQGMGWGICLHWAALARRRGWRLGIADAVAVRHDLRPPASGYDREAARAAAAELLAEREHIGWREAGAVLETWQPRDLGQ